jgi:hypothetical protein
LLLYHWGTLKAALALNRAHPVKRSKEESAAAKSANASAKAPTDASAKALDGASNVSNDASSKNVDALADPLAASTTTTGPLVGRTQAGLHTMALPGAPVPWLGRRRATAAPTEEPVEPRDATTAADAATAIAVAGRSKPAVDWMGAGDSALARAEAESTIRAGLEVARRQREWTRRYVMRPEDVQEALDRELRALLRPPTDTRASSRNSSNQSANADADAAETAESHAAATATAAETLEDIVAHDAALMDALMAAEEATSIERRSGAAFGAAAGDSEQGRLARFYGAPSRDHFPHLSRQFLRLQQEEESVREARYKQLEAELTVSAREVQAALASPTVAHLNASQRAAVAVGLMAQLSVIRGPPGTGKSRTACALIKSWIDIQRQRAAATGAQARGKKDAARQPGPGPVLAVASSNTAVDQLLEGLKAQGVRAVRIGDAVKIRAELQDCTLSAVKETHAGMAKIRQILTVVKSLSRYIRITQGSDEDPSFVSQGRRIRFDPAAEAVRLDHKSPEELLDSFRKIAEARENGVTPRVIHSMRRSVQRLLREAADMEADLEKTVLQEAEVIATTCGSTGSDALAGMRFSFIVLDESSQSLEPELLIPVSLLQGPYAQLCLIGDDKQLPPVVKTRAADPLRTTLFQRLSSLDLGKAIAESSGATLNKEKSLSSATGNALPVSTFLDTFLATCNFPVAQCLLAEQYRMHPAIASWPNWAFYQAQVRNASLVVDAAKNEDNTLSSTFPWPNPKTPVALVSVTSSQEASEFLTSYKNDDEASLAAKIAMSLLAKRRRGLLEANSEDEDLAARTLRMQRESKLILRPRDIGIITPYLGQVRLICEKLRGGGVSTLEGTSQNIDDAVEENDIAEDEQVVDEGQHTVGRRMGGSVEVRSVDGFQGREKAVIIFSAVRSNADKKLGFLGDPRRLNVALTRARRACIILADPTTLQHDPFWASWLHFVRVNQLVVDKKELDSFLA